MAAFENEYFDLPMQQQKKARGGHMNRNNLHPGEHGGKSYTAVFVVGLFALIILNLVCIFILSGNAREQVLYQMPASFVIDEETMYNDIIKPYIDKRLDGISVTVTANGATEQLRLADYGFEYAKDAHGQRELVTPLVTQSDAENEVTQLYCTYGALRYNHSALRVFLDKLAGDQCVPVVDSYYTIDYDASVMTVHPGTDGVGIDPNQFLSQLVAIVSSGADSGTVNCEVGNVSASSITADELYLWAHKQPKDAYSINEPDGTVSYYSEVIGIDFDKTAAASILASSGGDWKIPVTVTRPKIDLREIRKYTFPDLLASYFTYFSASNKSRSSNLTLAASKINGKVLEPGESLSFNDTVGERTPENGFQKATVYTADGTDEDYGGGICQTSSTLYYTCILANLKIDSRTNHKYTVTYMRDDKSGYNVYGNDATVNWGYTDYKFSNSKDYPIKIEMYSEGGKLYCKIWGTADGSTARFEYETTETKPYTVFYKKPGADKQDQSGHTGRTVRTYRVVYQDGKKVSTTHEHTSVYHMLPQIYYTSKLPVGAEYDVEYTQAQVKAMQAASTTTTAPPTTTTTAPAA
ncbi:MAG: VanW family protein [Clostridia bacterium]|nr:VanW family protein [Clostridia bacterium]